jgi:dolichol-phosphate mannosyltransferase
MNIASSKPESAPGSCATATRGRVLVSVATYNERDNLPSLIREIHATLPSIDVLVVDDNSPDGTGKLADELAATDSRVHVLHRPGKMGLGTAILAGANYAVEHEYDLFITMDADFSHHPRYLPALVAGMDRHDVMIGSRYISGGGSENWPWSRRFISRSLNLFVRLVLGLPARDSSGGFRCYRVAKLRDSGLDNLLSHGYSFQEEMLYRCCRAGCRVGETAIIFANRRAGASKVDPKEAFRSMIVLLRLGMGAIFRRPSRRAGPK